MSTLNEEPQKVMAKIKSAKLDWKKAAGAIVAIGVVYAAYSAYKNFYDDGETTFKDVYASRAVSCIGETVKGILPEHSQAGQYVDDRGAPDATNQMVVTGDSKGVIRVYTDASAFSPVATLSASKISSPFLNTVNRDLASVQYQAAKDCMANVLSATVKQISGTDAQTGFAAPSTPAVQAPASASPAPTPAP